MRDFGTVRHRSGHRAGWSAGRRRSGRRRAAAAHPPAPSDPARPADRSEPSGPGPRPARRALFSARTSARPNASRRRTSTSTSPGGQRPAFALQHVPIRWSGRGSSRRECRPATARAEVCDWFCSGTVQGRCGGGSGRGASGQSLDDPRVTGAIGVMCQGFPRPDHALTRQRVSEYGIHQREHRSRRAE